MKGRSEGIKEGGGTEKGKEGRRVERRLTMSVSAFDNFAAAATFFVSWINFPWKDQSIHVIMPCATRPHPLPISLTDIPLLN